MDNSMPITQPSTELVAGYIQTSFDQPLKQPPKDWSHYRGYRGNGIWGSFKTQEERSQYAREIVAMRKTKGGGRPIGVPHGWSKETIERAKEIVAQEIAPIVERLISEEAIDGSDRLAVERVKEALTVIRMPGQARRKQSAAKKLLKELGDTL